MIYSFSKEERWTKSCDECICTGESNKQYSTERIRFDLKECLDPCLSNPKCNGVEYWFGNFKCNECLSPKSYGSFTDITHLGFPPSIYKRGDERNPF